MNVRELIQPNSFPLMRYIKETDLLRDLIITTTISGFSSVLTYIFNIVAANRLPEESFSTFSGVVGLLYLIQIPALTLQTYFTKKSAGATDISRDELNDTAGRYIIYGLACSLAFFLVIPIVASVAEVPARYVIPVAVMAVTSVFTPTMRGILLGLKRITIYNIFTISESALRLAMFFILLEISTDAIWPIWSYVIPSAVVGITAYLSLAHGSRRSAKSERSMKDEKFGYFLVTLATFFLFNGLISVDLVLVNSEYRAPYAALSLVGKIVFFASALATSVLFSYFANSKSRMAKRRYLYVGAAMNIVIGLVLVYIFVVFGDLVHQLMFHGNYPEIKTFMTPLAVGMSFYSLTYLLMNYILSDKRRGQLGILFLVFLLQVILFLFRNQSLADAVSNQIILYATIAISIMFYWLYEEGRSSQLDKLN